MFAAGELTSEGTDCSLGIARPACPWLVGPASLPDPSGVIFFLPERTFWRSGISESLSWFRECPYFAEGQFPWLQGSRLMLFPCGALQIASSRAVSAQGAAAGLIDPARDALTFLNPRSRGFREFRRILSRHRCASAPPAFCLSSRGTGLTERVRCPCTYVCSTRLSSSSPPCHPGPDSVQLRDISPHVTVALLNPVPRTHSGRCS